MFQEKTTLVSGASRGIGRAIAQALYNAGARVYITGRDAGTLEKAAAEMDSRKDSGIISLAFDVSNVSEIKKAAACIEKNGHCVSILVNNAGINLRGPIETMTEENFDAVINTNLKSMYFLSQAMFPMLKKNGGKIINIASLMSEVARPTISPYCASKGGVKQLTKAMAVEWADYNIQVNAIAPGYIATDLNIPLMQNKEFNDFIIKRTPAKRWGTPEDIAVTAVFLASSGSDYITGQLIAVDGGILASL